jgi:S-adenosylmethionine:tRNA ribosyltransferase-isomerase
LIGKKETGGKVEILLVPPNNGNKEEAHVLIKGTGKIKQGTQIQFGPGFYGRIKEVKQGKGTISFSGHENFMEMVQRMGHIPLPPYIKREDTPLDKDRYQTVFAEKDGAIAAPTAGLHFTPSLLQSLTHKGIAIKTITLHIGIGTFEPVKVLEVDDHQMDAEWMEIPEETAREVVQTKKRGGKVIAVGTTVTRTLESFSNSNGGVRSGEGMTSLFIYPPYRFKVIDGLITNFHLPKSTLLMLVSAFVEKDFLMKAYQEAIEQKYRFYSYGDAMLIL